MIKTLLSELWPFQCCQVNQQVLKTEIYSALIGAMLVIPQAITFSYLAGLPSEYGMYSAIFVTFIAAMFGSSAMVGGPNTTSAILIGAAVLPLAGRGSSLYVEYVLLLTLMVGLIQCVIWIIRGGKYFQYFSPVVISAISTGVGVLIVLSAVDGITGINTLSADFFYQRILLLFYGGFDLINHYMLFVGGVTLISGWYAQKIYPKAYLIIAILVGYFVSQTVHMVVPQIVTEVEFIGNLPFTLLPLNMPNIATERVMALLDSAVIIALIGLAQSMVIIKDIKIQRKQIINDEKEVFAQAISNIAGAFFSSFAGAGSFNRTSVALTVGASTPIAAMLSSILLVIIVLLMQPILVTMPMPAMSAVLMLVGIGMIKPKKLRKSLRTYQDRVMFWITFLVILFFGLKLGIGVAILLSVINFLLHANQLEISDTWPADFQVITIHGNFFYASIDQLLPHFEQREGNLILNLDFVAYFDDTAAEYIHQEWASRAEIGHHLLIVAPAERHKHCLRRTGSKCDDIKLFENYAKARTALEVISVSRFINSKEKGKANR